MNPVPQMSLSAKELKELQENDHMTLSKVRRKVDQTNNPEGARVLQERGIILPKVEIPRTRCRVRSGAADST